MHETISNMFLGYIDINENVSNFVNEFNKDINPEGLGKRIEGWAVDISTDAPLTAGDFKVGSTGNKEQKVTFGVTMVERPDVAKFYNKNENDNNSLKYLKSGFAITFDLIPGEYAIVIREKPVFTISITNDKEVVNIIDGTLRLNTNAKPELVVVDNFYKDPDAVREFALKQDFQANEKYHKGSRTVKSFVPTWLKDELGRLLNMEVSEFYGANGVFQYCVAKDPIVYHYDTQHYAAMVYLTPNAPLQTGTCTYRSKITGLYGAATEEDALRLGKTTYDLDYASFNGNNFYDKHNMELVDSVANVYNRLVIFNARSLHSATSYFGDTKENGRLFQLFFFNVK